MVNTAFVVFSNGIGGAERAVEKIVKSGIYDKHRPLVIVNSEIRDYFVTAIGEQYVKDVGPLYLNNRLRMVFKRFFDFSILFALFKVNKIKEILEENNVHVVISNLMYDLYAIHKIRLNSLKKIAVVHGLVGVSDELPKFVFSPKYTRKMLLELDAVIAVSPVIESYLIGKDCRFINKVTTIENGVADNLPKNTISRNCLGLKKILFCGGTKNIKGGKLLHLVAKNLLDKGRRFELTIAGPVEINSYWHELQRCFPEYVKVVGFITEENLYNLLSRQNFVLMPSLSEGAPLVAFDAIKINTPVLASNIPAFQTYLSNEYLFNLTEKSLEGMLEQAIVNNNLFDNYVFKYSPLTWSEVWLKYKKIIDNDRS
jgi:glycosyltransferase involved in cell wall biosynthesis